MRVEPPLNENVTLCSDSNVHVTVPPRGMNTVCGEKALPVVAWTVRLAAMTVTSTLADFVTDPMVPVTVTRLIPAATPVTSPVLLTLALVWSLD